MVNDPNCGNPQSRTESTQKVRKLSKLSLTGFILSILSVCLLVLLRLPVKMQGDLRIALSICLYFSFTAALICSITGLILSSNGKRHEHFGNYDRFRRIYEKVYMTGSMSCYFRNK